MSSGQIYVVRTADFSGSYTLSGKYEWVSHTHVDGTLMASLADRNTLVSLKQKKSLIISAITGETQSFTQSQFDDMYS